MDIKSLACGVADKYGTRDPFRIAEDLGFIVIRTPLADVRGLRQLVKRRVILYVNSDLDEIQQRLVCAHEIGHHFLHRGMNRIFMDRETRMVSNKYENEAHLFSLHLIYSDEMLLKYLACPISHAATYMGVTVQLATSRMDSVRPFPYCCND